MTEHLPGDIQLVRSAGHIGKAIRVMQWLNGDGFADYEHARLYIGSGQFVEAQPGGAVCARHWPLDSDGLYWSSGVVDLTPKQRQSICKAAIGYIGVPYSFLDYASLATKRLYIPAPGLESYIRSTGHMICSQLVARSYWDGQAPLFDYWSGDVTPADIYNYIESKRH